VFAVPARIVGPAQPRAPPRAAEGGPQLAILLKRTPADMKDFESKKEQLRSSLGNMKRELSIGVFEEEFMTQCQLDPKLVQR